MPIIDKLDVERATRNVIRRNDRLTDRQVRRRVRARLAFLGIGRVVNELVGPAALKRIILK